MNQSIFWQERTMLARSLQSGKPIHPAYHFFDHRNKNLASLLNHFLKIYPQDYYSASWFLFYCRENGFAEIDYAKSVFSGVEVG
jgi:hypothetical protein